MIWSLNNDNTLPYNGVNYISCWKIQIPWSCLFFFWKLKSVVCSLHSIYVSFWWSRWCTTSLKDWDIRVEGIYLLYSIVAVWCFRCNDTRVYSFSRTNTTRRHGFFLHDFSICLHDLFSWKCLITSSFTKLTTSSFSILQENTREF